MESLIFLVLGLIIYWLSYISPQTDKIFYGFSGLLLLFSSISGFVDNSYFITGQEVITTNDNGITTETSTYIYSDSNFSSFVLPMTILFLSLYVFSALAVDNNKNGRSKKPDE